jgi:predicted nucleic acid-binding protein
VKARRVVPDASVAVKWFLDEPGSGAARRLLEEDGLVLHVPDSWYLEICSVFWKRLRRGEAGFTRDRLGELLELLAVVPVTAHPSRDLVPRSLGIALEKGLSVYDASCVAVAESQGATLVTADAHLAGMAKEWPGVAVELLQV